MAVTSGYMACYIIAFAGEVDSLVETLESLSGLPDGVEILVKATPAAEFGAIEALGRANNSAARVVALPDVGIYDAWMQACIRTQAEFVSFIGAGDRLDGLGVQALLSALQRVADLPVDVVYGDVELVSASGSILERHGQCPYTLAQRWAGVRRACPASPEAFVRRSSALRLMPELAKFALAGDVAMFLGLMRTSNAIHLPVVVARMLDGGRSTWPENALTVFFETREIATRLGSLAPVHVQFRFFAVCVFRKLTSEIFGRNASNWLFDLVRVAFGRPRRLSAK
jgi:hypothetical protein